MAAGGMGAMPQQSGQAGGMPQQPPMMPQVQRPQMPQQFGQSPFMGGGFNSFMGRGMGFNPFMGGMGRGMGFNPYGGMGANVIPYAAYGQSPFMGGMGRGMGFNPYGGYGVRSFGEMGSLQNQLQQYKEAQGRGEQLSPTQMTDMQSIGNRMNMLANQQSGQSGMTHQMPNVMQNALNQMLQQQQVAQGGALPTASQSVSPMAALGGHGIAGLLG